MIEFTVNILLISLETLAKMLQLKKKIASSIFFFPLEKKNLAVPDSTVCRGVRRIIPHGMLLFKKKKIFVMSTTNTATVWVLL